MPIQDFSAISYPLLGHIFETFIISECFKRFYNLGETPPLYFWRDQSQNEIDLLIYTGRSAFPVEIKLSQSFHPDFKKFIEQWLKLDKNLASKGLLIYCSEQIQVHTSTPAIPWYIL